MDLTCEGALGSIFFAWINLKDCAGRLPSWAAIVNKKLPMPRPCSCRFLRRSLLKSWPLQPLRVRPQPAPGKVSSNAADTLPTARS